MATIESNMSVDNAPVVTPNRAGEVITQRGYKSLLAAQVVVGNIVKLCKLPAGCVPVDLVVDFDDLDAHGTPTTTATYGILNADGDALATSAGALTTAQLGAGGIDRADDEDFSVLLQPQKTAISLPSLVEPLPRLRLAFSVRL